MENSPSNPAVAIFTLFQLLIKTIDLVRSHLHDLIERQKKTIEKNDETIKETKKECNTLEEAKKKNIALLREADNALKDLRKSLEPLAKPLGKAHAASMASIYNLDALSGNKGKYVKGGKFTEAGQVEYNKLMEEAGYSKESLEQLIDSNKHAKIINNTIAKYGEMYKGGNRELIDGDGKLTEKGKGELCMNFIENFVGDKAKEFMFGNKIENSIVKSKEQEDKNPGKDKPEPVSEHGI